MISIMESLQPKPVSPENNDRLALEISAWVSEGIAQWRARMDGAMNESDTGNMSVD